MTKPTSQSGTQPKASTHGPAPAPQDLQAAYQCHTLAQLVFAQLAAAYPWLSTTPPGAAGWTQGQFPIGRFPLGQFPMGQFPIGEFPR